MSISCCAAVWRSRRWPADKVSALTCTADRQTFALKYRTSAGGSWRTFRTFSPIFWKSPATSTPLTARFRVGERPIRKWEGGGAENSGLRFRFALPSLWSSDPVLSALVETLSFLSDDSYEFEFRAIIDAPTMAEYFEFKDKEETAFTPDEVMLFSGGLDSLSGAVEELVGYGKRVALVSHRSASKIAGAQNGLVDKLRSRFGANRVLHVPVWANLDGSLAREPTHRTRSFLFAALGVVTARMFGRDSIRFFENGVVSLNLPPVAQVVGARATRTTHPQTLAGFQSLFSAVLRRDFGVDNPFTWMTKTEVIERVAAHNCCELIRDTRSCTRVRDMTTLHPHCGQCSQCIDRRFAVLAASQEHEDPAEAYKVDLFTDKRPAGPDREMALGYVRSASMVNRMEDTAFFARYGEASRVVRHFSEPADVVAERIFDLYRRHASAVCRVFDGAIASHLEALRQGDLPADSLLPLVVSQYQGARFLPRSKRDAGTARRGSRGNQDRHRRRRAARRF